MHQDQQHYCNDWVRLSQTGQINHASTVRPRRFFEISLPKRKCSGAKIDKGSLSCYLRSVAENSLNKLYHTLVDKKPSSKRAGRKVLILGNYCFGCKGVKPALEISLKDAATVTIRIASRVEDELFQIVSQFVQQLKDEIERVKKRSVSKSKNRPKRGR